MTDNSLRTKILTRKHSILTKLNLLIEYFDNFLHYKQHIELINNILTTLKLENQNCDIITTMLTKKQQIFDIITQIVTSKYLILT